MSIPKRADVCGGAHHREPSFAEPTPPIRIGAAQIRIATNDQTLPPREVYRNAIAKSYAEQGYVEFAELLEAGYGCSACHVTRGLNRIPTDEELDLERFETVAIGGRAMRFVAEIAADGIIAASAQLERVLAQRLVHRIEVRNVVDPVDLITSRQVGEILASDPVAARSYRQLQQRGTLVIFDFGPPPPGGTLGRMLKGSNVVEIYVQRHRSARDVASTVVHESSHVHRSARGARSTVLDEVQARAREFLFEQKRRPTLAERRAIWNEVLEIEAYSDLPVR